MAKNFIIDGQILQTSAWHRGMGKYTLQVMQEMSNNAPADITLSIVFNTALKDNPERFEVVRSLCPRIKQLFAELPTPAAKPLPAEADAYRAALEQLIESEYQAQDNHYFITAPFYFDFYAEFPARCHKMMLFYDLTPMLFWRDLGGYFPPDLYFARFARILEAEVIFAISETTRQDLIRTFGLEPDAVITINGGFTKIADSAQQPKEFNVPDRYVLFPTGDLPHKNNDVAVRGFEDYCRQAKPAVPLLITSHFSQASKERLQQISPHVVFTNNVSDEELEWLYEHASAVLFASKYEGLGMPILDAAASKKPIIASKIAVFEEMSGEAFYYFDPASPDELAIQLTKALGGEGFAKKVQHYPAIMQKYTWANTCQAIVRQVAATVANTRQTPDAPKPRIAVACLHPGLAGQAGRYAEELYQALSQDFGVDYYFDANGYHYREMERPTFLDFIGCKVFDISKLTLQSYPDYDAVIYIIDDQAVPSRLAQRACVLPGIVLTPPHSSGANTPSGQHKTFMELISGNQLAGHVFSGRSYAENKKLGQQLLADIAGQRSHPNRRSAIIRKGGLNSAIIQRLKADYCEEA